MPKWKWKELIKRAERPTPNEFSKGELARLRQGASEVTLERILLEMGCQLGLREGEMRHAEFTDINRDKMLFTVRSKPKFNFSVKKNKQRSIPISKGLVDLLDKWRTTPARRTDNHLCAQQFDTRALCRFQSVQPSGSAGRTRGRKSRRRAPASSAPHCNHPLAS